MAEKELSLDESVEKALEEQSEDPPEETSKEIKEETPKEEAEEETPEEETPEEKEETSEEEETEEETEESEEKEEPEEEVDERTANAIALLDALEGPNGLAVLEEIAKRSGLKFSETKQPEKASQNTLELIKSALGEEYKDIDFLAPKLAKVFDALIEEKIEKPSRASREQQFVDKIKSEVSLFLSDNDDARKYHKQIAAKIKEMPPTPQTNLKEYLKDIYSLVNKRAISDKKVLKTVKKIEKNSRNADDISKSEVETTRNVKKGPKLPTIDDALAAAAEGIRFDY